MREFLRLGLRFLMICILLGGCVHNIYHFQTFVEKSNPKSNYDYYRNRYYNTNSSTRQVDVEEAEPIEDIGEVTVTPNDAYYGY